MAKRSILAVENNRILKTSGSKLKTEVLLRENAAMFPLGLWWVMYLCLKEPKNTRRGNHGKIKYFTQKELKKLFRIIEREADGANFSWGAESLLNASMVG